MKRNSIFLFSLVLSVIFLQLGQSAFAQVSTVEEITVVLKNSFWDENPIGFGYFVSFQEGNNFTFGYSGEGQEEPTKGRWSIEKSVILLKVDKENGTYMGYFKKGIMKCMVAKENFSIMGDFILTNDWGQRFIRTSPDMKEEARYVDGIVVIPVKKTEYLLNGNTRVRIGPGITYFYRSINFDTEGGVQEILPEGSWVKTLGRSKESDTIDGKTNYWFFCYFPTAVYQYETGWIWGEQLKPYKK